MTTRTILIKRNADRNYDRLFTVIKRHTTFGWDAVSLTERETDRGYEIDFGFLAPEVVEFVEGKAKDFEIL